MTLVSGELDSFMALLQRKQESIGNDPIKSFRDKSWDRFKQLGLPTRQWEPYRYIKLRHLFATPYNFSEKVKVDTKPFILPECYKSNIVMVNGNFCPELSQLGGIPSKVVVLPLQQAMRTYGTFLNNAWSKMLKEETDPFALLNAALHPQGVFIYVPPKCVIDSPIQILNIAISEAPSLNMPRVQLFAGAHSEMSVVATAHSLNSNSFTNQVIDMGLDDNAKVNFMKMACDEPEDSWHFDALRANLKTHSRLKTVQVTKGSATVKHDCNVSLEGENAEVLLNGFWMLDGKRESHTNIMIDHRTPHCRSYQLFKGVLSDSSRSSFIGKIMVRQAAQKTEAFQMNQNLLLSEHAHADSAPNLEIFADDVKASHGSTVGQIDKEQLFYMKTRGIPAEYAKKLLVRGFSQEVIDKLTIDSLRNSFY